jgi:hypothetical protein
MRDLDEGGSNQHHNRAAAAADTVNVSQWTEDWPAVPCHQSPAGESDAADVLHVVQVGSRRVQASTSGVEKL